MIFNFFIFLCFQISLYQVYVTSLTWEKYSKCQRSRKKGKEVNTHLHASSRQTICSDRQASPPMLEMKKSVRPSWADTGLGRSDFRLACSFCHGKSLNKSSSPGKALVNGTFMRKGEKASGKSRNTAFWDHKEQQESRTGQLVRCLVQNRCSAGLWNDSDVLSLWDTVQSRHLWIHRKSPKEEMGEPARPAGSAVAAQQNLLGVF